MNPYVIVGIKAKPDPPKPADILRVVSECTEISTDDICRKVRKREIVQARHIVLYLCIEYGHSTIKSGKTVKRDHATAYFAHEKIKGLVMLEIKQHDQLRRLITTIKTKLKQ